MPFSRIVIFDTETTDMDPENGAELCEIGYTELLCDGTEWQFGAGAWTYVETQAAFSPAARAVHHIDPASCLPGAPNCVSRDLAIRQLMIMRSDSTLWAAHNAPFDLGFVPELKGDAVLDTLQMARHIWPDAPKHGNQVLRYYLGSEPPVEYTAGLDPHRSQYDAAVTAAFLREALERHSPEELLRLSKQPLLLKTVSFGKHKDQPWSAVPRDYLAFLARGDMYRDDANIRHTVDHYLNRPRLLA